MVAMVWHADDLLHAGGAVTAGRRACCGARCPRPGPALQYSNRGCAALATLVDGPHYVNYHLEHHLMPGVPCYRLLFAPCSRAKDCWLRCPRLTVISKYYCMQWGRANHLTSGRGSSGPRCRVAVFVVFSTVRLPHRGAADCHMDLSLHCSSPFTCVSSIFALWDWLFAMRRGIF